MEMSVRRWMVYIYSGVAISALCILLAPEAVSSDYATLDPPELNSTGKIDVGGNLTISVEPVDDATDDALNLIVERPKDGKKITFQFDTVYRRFHLYAPNLTNSTVPDIVLITAAGDGSGATTYSADIYQIDLTNGQLKLLFYKNDLSDSYGDNPSGLWWYDLDFEVMPPDLQYVQFTLHSYWPERDEPRGNCKLLPKLKELVLRWDSNKSTFIKQQTMASKTSGCN